MLKLRFSLVSSLVLGFAAASNAQLFDFEGQTIGYAALISETNGGITVSVTPHGGGSHVFVSGQTFAQSDPWHTIATFGSRALVGSQDGAINGGDFAPLRFGFSTGVTAFSIQAGDAGGDDDGNVIMNVFSSSNTLLQVVSVNHGTTGPVTLSYGGGAASYFTIETNSPSFNLNSVFYDNLRISATAAVPGPAAALPFVLGMLASRRRRR